MNDYYLVHKISDNNRENTYKYYKYMLFMACENPTESWQLFCAFSLELLTGLVYKVQAKTLAWELLRMRDRVDKNVGLFPKSMQRTKAKYKAKPGSNIGKIQINMISR